MVPFSVLLPRSSPVRKNVNLGASTSARGKRKGHSTDLLTATVFGKRAAPKTSPRVDPILGSKNWTPKWGPS